MRSLLANRIIGRVHSSWRQGKHHKLFYSGALNTLEGPRPGNLIARY